MSVSGRPCQQWGSLFLGVGAAGPSPVAVIPVCPGHLPPSLRPSLWVSISLGSVGLGTWGGGQCSLLGLQDKPPSTAGSPGRGRGAARASERSPGRPRLAVPGLPSSRRVPVAVPHGSLSCRLSLGVDGRTPVRWRARKAFTYTICFDSDNNPEGYTEGITSLQFGVFFLERERERVGTCKWGSEVGEGSGRGRGRGRERKS